MSEVDRLSNSGLYPALPIADQRSSKDDSKRGPRPDQKPDKPGPTAGAAEPAAPPKPPRSLIDEYA